MIRLPDEVHAEVRQWVEQNYPHRLRRQQERLRPPYTRRASPMVADFIHLTGGGEPTFLQLPPSFVSLPVNEQYDMQIKRRKMLEYNQYRVPYQSPSGSLR